MATSKATRARTRGVGAILAAARELVLEKGPAKLSLREVAARAGYSPASLYEYFESKEALLSAIAREVGGRLTKRLATVPTHLAAPQRLVRLGLAYLAFARENPQDYELLFGRFRSARRSAQEPLAQGSPFALVREAVEAGIASQTLVAKPGWGAEEMSYGLWAMVHGMAMLQMTHLAGYHADFEEADRHALEAFVAGLR